MGKKKANDNPLNLKPKVKIEIYDDSFINKILNENLKAAFQAGLKLPQPYDGGDV